MGAIAVDAPNLKRGVSNFRSFVAHTRLCEPNSRVDGDCAKLRIAIGSLTPYPIVGHLELLLQTLGIWQEKSMASRRSLCALCPPWPSGRVPRCPYRRKPGKPKLTEQELEEYTYFISHG